MKRLGEGGGGKYISLSIRVYCLSLLLLMAWLELVLIVLIKTDVFYNWRLLSRNEPHFESNQFLQMAATSPPILPFTTNNADTFG